MQQTEFLVVGLGIAGILVSYELYKAGKSFIVVDDKHIPKASLAAGAVLNPLNLQHWKPLPHADLFLPHAINTYTAIGNALDCSLIHKRPMLIDLAGTQPGSGSNHLVVPGQDLRHRLQRLFYSPNQFLLLEKVWQVNATALYERWRSFLIANNSLQESRLTTANYRLHKDIVEYQGISAQRIIFCEGATAASNALFSKLPFTHNRGEALLLHIPELDNRYMYQSTLRLVPAHNQLFWCGSNYVWNYKDLTPDENWKQQTILTLKRWLKVPFTVADHIVAERPTTAGQVFMAGQHPTEPCVALLNGLGTRGFSAGPYLANYLVKSLLHKESLTLPPFLKPLRHWIK